MILSVRERFDVRLTLEASSQRPCTHPQANMVVGTIMHKREPLITSRVCPLNLKKNKHARTKNYFHFGVWVSGSFVSCGVLGLSLA